MTKGFSLIEMVTTMAVISIMASIGLPSFNKFVERQHLVSDINSVVRVANFARTEAIKTKHLTSLCGYQNESTCSRNWKKVQIYQPHKNAPIHALNLTGNYKSVTWSSFQKKPSLTFNAMGFSTHVNGSLYLCHGQFNELHRAIRFSKSGKATIVNDPVTLVKRCN